MESLTELARVAQAGKDRDPGWYRVHRRLSIHVTLWALRAGVPATACSLLMMAAAAAGAVALAATAPAANVLGFALGYAAFLLDKVDGEVARCRGTASARGVLLDRLHHRLVEPTLFVAVAVHEYRLTGAAVALVAGFVTVWLANAIEETQQLPPVILLKRVNEGADLPPAHAPAPGRLSVTLTALLRPLKGLRMLIVALPLFALCYVAEALVARPVPLYALVASAAGLAVYTVFQALDAYFGRLDHELGRVAATLAEATHATSSPPRSARLGESNRFRNARAR